MTMVENLEELVRELSEIYDPNSIDSYVSLYLSKDTDKKFMDRRIRAIKSILKGEKLKNFIETIDDVESSLKKNAGDNVAVFASHKHKFLKFISLPVKLENLLIVDSSPYIRPLARIQDEWESFTLLLVSTNSAKIYSVDMGLVEDTKKLSADIMNRHKKGGCSQARFNRLRRGAIHAFLKEVAEELEKKADDRIVIAGPGNAKNQLIELLSKPTKDKIVETIDIDVDDEAKLMKESIHLISEREKQESFEAVQQLKEEILKDGLAVYGIRETLDAVKNGQVELLLIKKDCKLRGWICENCQVVDEGNRNTCPYCEKQTSEVDVLEEILEFAERTDAEIEFTNSEELKDLGCVGAILRYK